MIEIGYTIISDIDIDIGTKPGSFICLRFLGSKRDIVGRA